MTFPHLQKQRQFNRLGHASSECIKTFIGTAASVQSFPAMASETIAITRLISTGTTELALLAAVAHLYPNLSPAEL